MNRRAYTLQSIRPHPETGRHYYFRPKAQEGQPPPALGLETLRRHLAGELTVGLYSINPKTQRSKWVAIDADYKNAIEHLLKLQYELTQDGVEPALEKSNRGGHLWIFFEKPALARDCRVYIYHTALRLGLPIKGAGLPEGIEIFPRQDEIGPMNSATQSAHRSAFIGAQRKAAAGGSGSTTRTTPSPTNWLTFGVSAR